MKEGTLMRVLFCKINCPLICFCKPPAHHLYASGRPLNLPTPFADSCPSDKPSPVAKEEEAANGNEEEPAENALKSCIKKLPNEPVFGEKRVQWRDNIGKQLAEIKEFESSETGDTDNEEESSRCVCIIL